MSIPGSDIQEKTKSKTEEELKEPPLYKVLLLNDDYTTMEFVVDVLMYVFQKSVEDATKTMLDVHRKGIGLCGIYTFDVAETKVDMVLTLAKGRGFPLKCTMEKV